MSMKLTSIAIAILTLSISSSCLASSHNPANPDWDTLSVSVGTLSLDKTGDGDAEIEYESMQIAGTMLLNEDVFVIASYMKGDDAIDENTYDAEEYYIGIGYRYGITPNSDVYGFVAHHNEDFSKSGFSVDPSVDDSVDSYRIGLGFKTRLGQPIELDFRLSHIDNGPEEEEQISLTAGANFFVTDHASVGLKAGIADDYNKTSLSLRYSF